MGRFCPWPQLPLVTSGLLPHTQKRLTTSLSVFFTSSGGTETLEGRPPLPLSHSLPPTPLLLTGLLTTLGSFQRWWPHRHSLGGVCPVGPEAPTLLFSSDDPGAAFLPSFGSWDQHFLFPKVFLLLTHCSPQLALYTTSELTTSLPACFPAGFTRVDQQSHGLS